MGDVCCGENKLQIAHLMVSMLASVVSLVVDQILPPPITDTTATPSLALRGAGDCPRASLRAAVCSFSVCQSDHK